MYTDTSYKTFTLTPELITLLRASYVSDRLSDCEYGAAEIDCKRPYGNGDVEGDIIELLWSEVEFDEAAEEWPEGYTEKAAALHRQTPAALQVVLASGSFEPGEYRTSSKYGIDWKRVS
jgi:hypothetical protein